MSRQTGIRGRRFAGGGARVLLSAILCPVLLCAQAPKYPQEQETPRRPVSDLAELNLGRVSATATQIEVVLRREPALMLELKRWVANEATSRGQILEDADLADEAMYKRLREEVEFRAAATRLLQHYGFLVPKVNPESELGKERELVLQEKAKLIARRQLEEENRLFLPPVQQANASLEEDEDEFRRSRRSRDRRQDVRDERESSETNGDLRPGLSDPSMLRAREALMQSSALGGSAALGGLQGRTDSFAAAAALSGAGMASGAMLSSGADAFADLQAGRAERDFEDLSRTTRAGKSSRNRDRGPEPQRKDKTAPEAEDSSELISTPNPYSSIPSLYDLYRQAAPRPARLERFGAEVFANNDDYDDQLPMDLPVGPDYVVGPGDSLAIDIWGGISQRLRRQVDREGRITLPEAGPLLVSGRTMGDVQRTVQQLLRTQFRDVSADVSLARLRSIRVYVVGDAVDPGAYEVSSLSTPLNALLQAGGATERGSLRTLRHYRGKQLIQEVDVYDLLLRGIRSDLRRLENGDTVLVPPLGATVRVEGMVRRPAVYELRGEKSLSEVLDLAGGMLPTATLRNIQVQRLEANEKRTMLSINIDPAASRADAEKAIREFRIGENDEVRVYPIAQHNLDAVYLDGHVLRPGKHSYKAGMRVTDLVTSYADLLPEPATKYAEIIRLNAPDFRPSVESFDLAGALENPARAPELKPLDTVRIYSRYDFEEAPAVWVGGEVYRPGAYLTPGVVRLRDAVHLAGGAKPDAAMDSVQVFRTMPDSSLKIFSVKLGAALAGNPADNIVLSPRDRVVVHRNLAKVDPATVYIKGEVSKPGRYPLTTNMRVGDLIRVAGGLKRSADTETADLTRFIEANGKPEAHQQAVPLAAALAGDASGDLLLRDGDSLAIRQLSGWTDIAASITVRGEVNAPGTYGIRPGEKLSSILKRAGGLRPTAYAAGTTLERISVREVQEQQRADLILRLQTESDRLKVSLKEAPHDQQALQQATTEQLRRAVERLKEIPVRGYLVVYLRPDLQRFENSNDDIEVRAGDVLTIPKKPSHVTISGQVYNPNAIAYRPGKSVGWYLERAGGTTDLANRKDIFIVRANGAVISGNSGWWSGFTGESVLPGDVIVVPEKPIISSFWTRNGAIVAQILSSAAVTVALSLR